MNVSSHDVLLSDEERQRTNQNQNLPPYNAPRMQPYIQQQNAHMPTQYQQNLPHYVIPMNNNTPQGYNLYMFQGKTHLLWSVINTLCSFFFLYGYKIAIF